MANLTAFPKSDLTRTRGNIPFFSSAGNRPVVFLLRITWELNLQKLPCKQASSVGPLNSSTPNSFISSLRPWAIMEEAARNYSCSLLRNCPISLLSYLAFSRVFTAVLSRMKSLKSKISISIPTHLISTPYLIPFLKWGSRTHFNLPALQKRSKNQISSESWPFTYPKSVSVFGHWKSTVAFEMFGSVTQQKWLLFVQ